MTREHTWRITCALALAFTVLGARTFWIVDHQHLALGEAERNCLLERPSPGDIQKLVEVGSRESLQTGIVHEEKYSEVIADVVIGEVNLGKGLYEGADVHNEEVDTVEGAFCNSALHSEEFGEYSTHLDRRLAVAMDVLEELEEVQLGPHKPKKVSKGFGPGPGKRTLHIQQSHPTRD